MRSSSTRGNNRTGMPCCRHSWISFCRRRSCRSFATPTHSNARPRALSASVTVFIPKSTFIGRASVNGLERPASPAFARSGVGAIQTGFAPVNRGCKLSRLTNTRFLGKHTIGGTMKLCSRLLLIAFATTALTQLSSAQRGMMMQPPDIAGVFNPVVGSGASYEMVKTNGEKIPFDMAVVDKDASGGYWIKYSMQNPNLNGPVYMKNLMVHQSDDIIIQRSIMQM